MLLVILFLAVPLSLAALETAGQLARTSRVYDSRLTREYNLGAGVEVAIHEVQYDPNFDDGLTPADPSKEIAVVVNENAVTTTITKIFSSQDLVGQGLIVNKEVVPTTAPVNAPTTFTYAITIENKGTNTVILETIRDYLPPHFSYAGPTAGITTDNPTIASNEITSNCGNTAYTLDWSLPPNVDIQAGEKLTLSFNASGTLPDGAYFNQVQVSYRAWWDASLIDVYTPYAAPVIVGTANPKCGHNLGIRVDKNVEPPEALPGVETEFTYTITVENTTAVDLPVHQIEDLLPPGFIYVVGSSSDITASDPSEELDPNLLRWRLVWGDAATEPPLTTIPAGQSKTQVFKARGNVGSGLTYLNEVFVAYETEEWIYGVDAYADIVIALDNSGSIDSTELEDLKATANEIVDAFSVDTTEERIRIGVTRFRGESAPVVAMTDVDVHLTDVPLHDGINGLSQGGPDLSSGTNIVAAIQGAATHYATGLGDRPEMPNLMILITDGLDTVNTLADIQAACWASGAEIFAVGVGSVDVDTLNAIACNPSAGHVFYTSDFSGLLSLVDDIVSANLVAAKTVARAEGGASSHSSVSGGALYDLETLAPDGSTLRSRIVTYESSDQVDILSWQQ